MGFLNDSATMSHISTIRDLVLIGVSLFTGWWAFKTFSNKEKINDLKNISNALVELKLILFYDVEMLKRHKLGNETRIVEAMRQAVLKLSCATDSSWYISDRDRNRIGELVHTLTPIMFQLSQKPDVDLRDKLLAEYQEMHDTALDAINKIRKKYV